MSLFHGNEFEREDEQAIDHYKPSDLCFKCARPLNGDDLLVYVSGYDNEPEIWMHVDCAHDLALDLLKDFLAVKRMKDRKKARAELGLPDGV
jgi:hypothetical protein